MDLDSLVRTAVHYFHQYTVVSLVFLAALAVFVFIKPKQAFKAAVFALVIGVMFYVISLVNDSMFSGVQQKDKMIKRSTDAIVSDQ